MVWLDNNPSVLEGVWWGTTLGVALIWGHTISSLLGNPIDLVTTQMRGRRGDGKIIMAHDGPPKNLSKAWKLSL